MSPKAGKKTASYMHNLKYLKKISFANVAFNTQCVLVKNTERKLKLCLFTGKLHRLLLILTTSGNKHYYLQKNLIISINQQRLQLRAFPLHVYDLGI